MQEDAPPLSGDFFVQVRNFPKRKLLLKRGVSADDYFSYSNENGCDVWGLLCSVKEALYEPCLLYTSFPPGYSISAVFPLLLSGFCPSAAKANLGLCAS